MIVSASRRTDVPAFYAPWLVGRVDAGYVDVANPFFPSRVRRVDLRPAPDGGLEVLALWTRRPGPLLGALPGWEGRGLRSLWSVTITGYPGRLEPKAPPWAVAAAEVRALCGLVGAERVAWRYDPVLLCPEVGVDAAWHRRRFGELASRLEGCAATCVLSLYDDYAKARRRLRAEGLSVETGDELAPLAADLAALARAHGIEPQSCCEELGPAGVSPGACIDGARIDRLWDLGYAGKSDPGQRKGCRCAPSVDLGAYDTCLHGCLYCYATKSDEAAKVRFGSHLPTGDRLV